MSQYAVGNGSQIIAVQSSDPEDLQERVNAAIGALVERSVIGLDLAGAGDGYTFVVLIQHAASIASGSPPTSLTVRCYLAGEAEALMVARAATSVPTAPLKLVDEQCEGAAKGTRFMGMSVYGVPPTQPTGQGALVQAGFDMVVSSVVQDATVSDWDSIIRRDNTDPLQVQLFGVTPGNILVLDASGLTLGFEEGPKAPQDLMPVVSFNGNATYAPGNGFFWTVNSLQESNSVLAIVEGSFYLRNGFRCYVPVVVPGGATTATVQLAYTSGAAFAVGGQNGFASKAPSITLSAMELLASAVTQPGPTVLVAF